ncbi:unnamed protein product [Eruca vesicaria subsp. sativa]|uniref:Formyl transferase N-terminal domain-containing protein n=1 Tax=Eruca vesicaria subsp. sativa TaxID=29727 RepID=A0ABC8IW05_ERUVS|nr:unnamed protein product [Eruca vesicaria subsp. sativa]
MEPTQSASETEKKDAVEEEEEEEHKDSDSVGDVAAGGDGDGYSGGECSSEDHCLVGMLHKWQDGKLPVDITCVISNHERAPNTHIMRFLQRHGISQSRILILEFVKDTDFIVLSRYMQVLSGNFLKGYGKDVINIHHGLLPSFKGRSPAKHVKLVILDKYLIG